MERPISIPVLIVTGETYKVIGTTGNVVYNAVTYNPNQTFVGVTGVTKYTTTGDSVPVDMNNVLVPGSIVKVVNLAIGGHVTYNGINYIDNERITVLPTVTSYTTSNGHIFLTEVAQLDSIALEFENNNEERNAVIAANEITSFDSVAAEYELPQDTIAQSVTLENIPFVNVQYQGTSLEVTENEQYVSGLAVEYFENKLEFTGISFEIIEQDRQLWQLI